MIRETVRRRAPKQCQESPHLKKQTFLYIYKKETKSEDKMTQKKKTLLFDVNHILQSEFICQVLPGI